MPSFLSNIVSCVTSALIFHNAIETYTDNINLNIYCSMIINKGAANFYDFGRLVKKDE